MVSKTRLEKIEETIRKINEESRAYQFLFKNREELNKAISEGRVKNTFIILDL